MQEEYEIRIKNIYDRRGTDEEIQCCAYYMRKIQLENGTSEPTIEEVARHVPEVTSHLVQFLPQIIMPQVIDAQLVSEALAPSAQKVSEEVALTLFKPKDPIQDLVNSIKTLGGGIKGFVNFLLDD